MSPLSFWQLWKQLSWDHFFTSWPCCANRGQNQLYFSHRWKQDLSCWSRQLLHWYFVLRLVYMHVWKKTWINIVAFCSNAIYTCSCLIWSQTTGLSRLVFSTLNESSSPDFQVQVFHIIYHIWTEVAVNCSCYYLYAKMLYNWSQPNFKVRVGSPGQLLLPLGGSRHPSERPAGYLVVRTSTDSNRHPCLTS